MDSNRKHDLKNVLIDWQALPQPLQYSPRRGRWSCRPSSYGAGPPSAGSPKSDHARMPRTFSQIMQNYGYLTVQK
jgi:hypothetical protein